MKRIQAKKIKPQIIFNILTMYPDVIEGYLNDSYIKRAREEGLVSFNLINHREVNKQFSKLYDYPFGGGPGQLMRVDSFFETMEKYLNKNNRTIIFSPKGKKITQDKLFKLSNEKVINLICPRFEGYDKRIEDYCTDVLSLGDFVLNGGEIPALTIIEGVIRLISKDIKTESINEESFGKEGHSNLHEHDQYTRPRVFKKKSVPEVLLSGDHKKIKEFKKHPKSNK